VAKEFIVLALGEIWLTSAEYLQIICIAGAVIPISTLLADLLISKGRSDIFMWSTFVLGICQIIALVLLHPYGIRMMVYAYVTLTLLWVFVWHFFVRRHTGYTLPMLLKDTIPFALAAIAVMAVTGFATQSIPALWLKLLCRIIIAAILYYVVMRLAGVQILRECQQFIVNKLKPHKI
jgi:O-antigen/teichoic acid export membrane protein